ncbi:MAG: hypothetical protein AAGB29_08845 [Planctomycetota bacterium]
MSKSAICVMCGHQKVLPLEMCTQCGFDPSKSKTDLKAKSILLTDTHRTSQELQDAKESISRGEPIQWDQTEVDELIAVLKVGPGREMWLIGACSLVMLFVILSWAAMLLYLAWS